MPYRPKDKRKSNPSQLISFVPDSYLDRTSRPIYALLYLLGLIILYELGTIFINIETLSRSLNQPQIRVVAFVWVQGILEYIGFSQRMMWIATPLAVIIILLALQITSRTRWHVRVKDFIPMTIECAFLALPLIVLSLLVNRAPQPQPNIACATSPAPVCLKAPLLISQHQDQPATSTNDTQQFDGDSEPNNLIVNIVTGIGAGIYEELVFRLILICLLMLLFQNIIHLSRSHSIILSVLISAVLFSAHHHIYFLQGRLQLAQNDPLSLAKFVFRAIAGIYFAVLFAVRGFAITAGTHAFYNIIAALLNAFYLAPVG
jgi:hypothetical protein